MIGFPVTLDGSASFDPNNDQLTYSWVMTGKPGTSAAVLDNFDKATPEFTPDVAGNYEFQLIVSDGKTFSDPATVSINANYENVAVPNLSGKTQTEAESLIIESHLSVGAITQTSSDTVTAGLVMSQDPAQGTQAVKGSPVGIILSTGPSVDTEKPTLSATLDRTPAVYQTGETSFLYIDATDNSKSVNVTLTVDGNSVPAKTPATEISTANFAPGSNWKKQFSFFN